MERLFSMQDFKCKFIKKTFTHWFWTRVYCFGINHETAVGKKSHVDNRIKTMRR